MLLNEERGSDSTDERDAPHAAMDHLATALARLGGMTHADDRAAIVFGHPRQGTHQWLHFVGVVHVDAPEIRLDRIDHHETRAIPPDRLLEHRHILQGELMRSVL